MSGFAQRIPEVPVLPPPPTGADLPTLGSVRLLVLSDTHLSAATLDRMPSAVWALAEEADAVLHAGDVVDVAVLDALRERAPVHAVLGNNDHGLARVLPELWEAISGASRSAWSTTPAPPPGAGPGCGDGSRGRRWSCSATATTRSWSGATRVSCS